MNILHLAFALVVPLTPSIVDPVQTSTNAIPAAELALTVVPKSDWTTVGPPIPVDPVAALQSES